MSKGEYLPHIRPRVEIKDPIPENQSHFIRLKLLSITKTTTKKSNIIISVIEINKLEEGKVNKKRV